MYKRPGQDIKQGLYTWQLVAAGGSAGAVQGTLTYPLDLIKTRLALAKDSAYRSPNVAWCCCWELLTVLAHFVGRDSNRHYCDAFCCSMVVGVRYNGIIDCMRRTAADEGIRGLYSGFGLSLWVVIPYVAIQMTTFDVMQRKLRGMLDSGGDVKGGNLGYAALGGTKALAGAMAGIATQTATYPGNTMIKRMQSNGAGGKPKLYANTIDCIRQILAKEGVGGFYRGLWLNVIK